MNIATCRTYHAISSGTNLLRMPDKKSVFKIYYLSIIKRDNPEAYEAYVNSVKSGSVNRD